MTKFNDKIDNKYKKYITYDLYALNDMIGPAMNNGAYSK